jgi:hypothetical protein
MSPGLANRFARTTTNVFHDITQGNNFVPRAKGSPGCVNGSMGYAATPGVRSGSWTINGNDDFSLFAQDPL